MTDNKKELFKAVKNYLNELNVDRASIDYLVESKIEERISHINNLNVEKYIVSYIRQCAAANKLPDYFNSWNYKSLDSLIAETVQSTVNKLVQEKMKNVKISINFEDGNEEKKKEIKK